MPTSLRADYLELTKLIVAVLKELRREDHGTGLASSFVPGYTDE